MLNEASIVVFGFPNAGKSSFLNTVLDCNLCSVSRTAGTTRHSTIGVSQVENLLLHWIDTPGLYFKPKRSSSLIRSMHREATQACFDADLKVFIVDCLTPTGRLEEQMRFISQQKELSPDFILINKTDLYKNKNKLLVQMTSFHEAFPRAGLIPLSAHSKDDVDRAVGLFAKKLRDQGMRVLEQEAVASYENVFTLTSMRQISIDHIRGAFLEGLTEEVPLETDVKILEFDESSKDIRIQAEVWAAKPGQKAILIGKKAERVKRAGTLARTQLEGLFGKPVHLMVHVKVKDHWTENEANFQELRT